MDEHVISFRRITAEAAADLSADAVVQAMRELGPASGDFVVLRCSRERAEQVERQLQAMLFTAGPQEVHHPLGGDV